MSLVTPVEVVTGLSIGGVYLLRALDLRAVTIGHRGIAFYLA